MFRLLEGAASRRRGGGEDVVGEAAQAEGHTQGRENSEQHKAPR